MGSGEVDVLIDCPSGVMAASGSYKAWDVSSILTRGIVPSNRRRALENAWYARDMSCVVSFILLTPIQLVVVWELATERRKDAFICLCTAISRL